MGRKLTNTGSTASRARWLLAIMVASTVVVTAACSSTPKADEPATLVYVGSSDDSWAALQIALIDLGYDIESENRDEGKIRATREAGDDHPASVLTIDQIARNETISLYVRAAAPPGGPSMDASRRMAMAEEFLAPVKALLYK